MKRKVSIISLSAVLSIGLLAQTISAAEIWSDGDWTLGQPTNISDTQKNTTPVSEQPQPSVYTEIWSESVETEVWTEPAQTKTALTITISPVIENGSVLVPLRGLLEQLGFSIEWHSKEQLVVVQKEGTTVKLTPNSKTALINGKIETLQSPAKMINGSVFVPLRFISQATGSKVDWDAATTKVTIDEQYYFYVNNAKQPQNQEPKQPVESNFYTGVWAIWVPGGFAITDSNHNSDGTTTVTEEYVSGAEGKTLTIKADGSYTWDAVGGLINGVWKPADNGRLLLIKGQYGYDWYVQKVDQNEIKIFAGYGMYEEGTRIK